MSAGVAAGKASIGAPIPVVTFSSFRLDDRNQCLWRDNQLIRLQPKVYALLRYLVDNPRRLVTKQELLDALWGPVHVGDAVLKTHLNQLRSALHDDARHPTFIETLHRRGYRFIAPVDRVAPGASTLARGLEPRSIVIGRELELKVLLTALDRCLAGRSQVVFIAGEAGIGKTTLVNAFLGRVAGRPGVLYCQGRCREHGPVEPFAPVLEALGRLCHNRAGAAAARELALSAPAWLSQVLGLVNVAPSEAVRSPANAGRMLRELLGAIPALTREAALTLVIDDVHWADHSTLELLDCLTRSNDAGRLLLVATHRPEELCLRVQAQRTIIHCRDLYECLHCELAPFDVHDVRALLHARFGAHRFPSALAQTLCDHVDGHPLFLACVVDLLVKSGLLHEAAGQWQLGGELDVIARALPVGAVAMVERSLGRLSPFEREVLDTASVAGREFSCRAVAAAMNHDVLAVEAVCMRWIRQRWFIRMRGTDVEAPSRPAPDYEFSREIFRRSVYERIPPGRRAELSRRLGNCEEGPSGEQQTAPPALPRHLEGAGDHARSVHHHRLGAERAWRRAAYREVIEHAGAALALVKRLPEDVERRKVEAELQLLVAAPLAIVHGCASPAAEVAYQRAWELQQGLGDAVLAPAAVAGMGTFWHLRGRHRQAEESGRELFEQGLRQDALTMRLEAQLLLGRAQLYLGKLVEAEERFQQVLDLYQRARQSNEYPECAPDPRVTALTLSAWVAWHRGESQSALARARRAGALARERSCPFSLATALSHWAMLCRYHGDRIAMRDAVRALQALSVEHDLSSLEVAASSLHCIVRLDLPAEQPRAAVVFQTPANSALRAAPAVYGTGWCAMLAEALGEAGQFDEALRALAVGFDAARERHEVLWLPELYRLYGSLVGINSKFQTEYQLLGFEHMCAPADALRSAVRIARQIGSAWLETRAIKDLRRHPAALD
jgi:DNA-binding winged helix-turn-helix (wHTH) protein/tetratricopeptide (TPR) repeat protein